MPRLVLVFLFLSCATTRHAEAEREGHLVQSDIQNEILDHRDQMRPCFEAERRRTPGVGGKILMRFQILPTGETRDIQVTGAGDELAACLREVFAAFRFPQHTVQGDPITYPLKF